MGTKYSNNNVLIYRYWISSSWFLLFVFISKVSTIDVYNSWTISAGSTYASYKFNVLQHMTGISPYFELNSDGLSPDPPQDCTVDKVVYQIRHGSTYVNDNDYELTIEPFLHRLNDSFDSANFSKSKDLAFLTHWTSPITDSKEQIEKLSKLGFLESFNFGTRLAYRYPHLIPTNKNESFKIWTADSNRTSRSAEALLSGILSEHEIIGKVVYVSENKTRGANTLTPAKTCPKYRSKSASKQMETWLKHYTIPIVARLNFMVEGFQFSSMDVLAMQELCGYETIIRGSSPFCGVFTPEEWLSFEYYFDIRYFYELGYGNDLSPSLGMPWIVATSDLLSNTTTTDQHLYISISHRQMPALVLTALGLYNNSDYLDKIDINSTMPINEMNYQRVWKSSSFITFMSNIAFERLKCTSTAYRGSFVRILVNSVPKPLPRCSTGPGASCPLEQYIDYIKHRSDLFDSFSNACGISDETSANKLSIFVKDDVD